MYRQYNREGEQQRIHRPAAGACGPFEIDTFEDKLTIYRDACVNSLKEYLVKYTESYYDEYDDKNWVKEWNWAQALPDKGKLVLTSDPATFKIATNVSYRNNKPCFPPAYSRLSDELVYLATKFINAGVRWKLYPYEFVMGGDIDPKRIPTGPAPIVWAHGLPFLPVYKGYYVLTGRQHASWAGWKLDEKMYKHMAQVPVWSIGPVVAPGSLVAQTKQCREEESNAPPGMKRTVERHARFWAMQSGRQCERGAERFQATRDVVTTCPHWGAVAPRREDGLEFGVIRLCDIPGFSVHIGPESMNETPPQVLSRELFQRFNLVAFDYDASVKRPYRCVKEPAMFPLKPMTSRSFMSAKLLKRRLSQGPGNGRGKRRRIQDDESEDDVEDTDSDNSTDTDTNESDANMDERDANTNESDAEMNESDANMDERDADAIEPTEQDICDEPVEGTSHDMITPAPSNMACSQDNENQEVECAERSQNNPAHDDAHTEVQNEVHIKTQAEIQDDTQVETQVDTQTHAQAVPQTNTVADTQVETQVEAQADPQADPQADTQVHTQAENQTDTQAETQADAQADIQAETQNA
ncbi:hypothetical protein N7540_007308 [Penicillium herquei]|nr:hypothetical protein N7540_007308 [Penicillium herquei]